MSLPLPVTVNALGLSVSTLITTQIYPLVLISYFPFFFICFRTLLGAVGKQSSDACALVTSACEQFCADSAASAADEAEEVLVSRRLLSSATQGPRETLRGAKIRHETRPETVSSHAQPH